MVQRLCRWLLVGLLLLPVWSAAAQTPAGKLPQTQTNANTSPAAPVEKTETQEHLDASVQQLADKLAAIQKRLDVNRPSPATLKQIGEEITPLVTESQALVDRLTPRVAALKAPLDQLGPKPENGEPADIAKERETLQKTYDENDALLKRSKASLVLAQKIEGYVALRQRTLFTTSLFERSTSILSPPLWASVARETPDNVADITRAFRNWLDGLNRDFTAPKLVAFWTGVLVLVLSYWPLSRLARRFLLRDVRAETPSAWQKILVATGQATVRAGLVIGILFGVIFLFALFTTSQPWVLPLFNAVQAGIVRVAIAAGLARGLLSPRRPNWRLVDLDDTIAEKLTRIVIAVAAIVSIGKVTEALNETINASLEVTIASRGVGALLVAGALTAALVDLSYDPDSGKPVATQQRDLYGLLRGLAWTLILVVTVSVLVGYISFASFLTQQLVLVAVTGSILFLLVRLIDEACNVGLQPSSRLGRSLLYTVGLRQETLRQLPVLLSGAARLCLTLIAALIVIAPWGLHSTDLSANLGAILFGFKVGDVTVSIADIAVAILIFALALAVTHSIQNWLEDRYLPTTRLDPGLRNSIKTSLGYAGVVVAVSLAAARLGVDFQKIAIVAGALSVGIGFGLQSIVNNFVSGLILLWERAVRVGDWVVVGPDQGYVRKINVRSTEIETFDRAAVIVPNSNLVSGVVKNLMRTDSVGRLNIDVTVNATADPEQVRDELLDIARGNEDVVSLPSPQVRFTDLTATSMTFALYCFVADVETMARTKSDLYFAICKRFRARKFFDGPPPDPTRVDLTGLDRLEALLRETGAARGALDATPLDGR